MAEPLPGKITMVHELWIENDHPQFEHIDPEGSYTFENVGSVLKTTWSGCRPVKRDDTWVFDLLAPDVMTSVEPV